MILDDGGGGDSGNDGDGDDDDVFLLCKLAIIYSSYERISLWVFHVNFT